MDEKHRLSGFKALLASHKTNSYHLADTDGDYRLWRDLSAEGRLESITRDAAYYGVPFEQFAQAVRESVDNAAIEETALRLAMRSGRKLHDLDQLFPDDGRTEPPPPLVERVRELLDAESSEHDNEAVLTAEEQSALRKEIAADTEVGKREDAHWYGKDAFQKILNEKSKAPAPEKGKDRGIER